MDTLTTRIELAKTDKSELNQLITDYIPFLKSEVSKSTIFGIEYDDRLSFAMLVFMNCVYQYDEGKGNFLSFVSTSLRNKLIDESRKLSRHSKNISLDIDTEDTSKTIEEKATIAAYSGDLERREMREEIEDLAKRLLEFNIDFSSLEKISPKQKRSRQLSANIAYVVAEDKAMLGDFFRSKKLPQGELARRLNISEKTIEKHRRYIVTLIIILSGDFPAIKAFIPKKEVER